MKTHCLNFSKLKKFLLLLFIAFICHENFAQSTQYDWTEKIQLYGHGFSIPVDFTETEYDSIANMFKIFTVEKRHAYNSYGGNPSTERATIGTAAKIKAINPDAKVLLYWNSVMNYESLYESNTEFGQHPEWIHSIWATGYEIYDLENPACQDWWVNSIVEIIEDGNLDGVFLDAGPKAGASGLSAALATAIDRVRAEIGNDKIVVYNGYRVVNTTLQAGPEIGDHTSGVFIEFFLHSPLDTKEEAALLFDSLTDAYHEGKVILPRGTPHSYLPGVADPFAFSFASFLLFYGPNTYWIYNDGYNKTDGMFDYYPEYYDIATGASLGSPQRNGWVYTREFENYTVTVDLENLTSSIEPKASNSNNVALNGVASQSSDFSSTSGLANLAIDGDTNGNFSGGSVSHTLNESNSWWEVDLGTNYTIDDIIVYGRTDACCITRLSDYTVSVVSNAGATTFSKVVTDYPNPSEFINTSGVTGQIVRVQLNGNGALALAEVQVHGSTSCATFDLIEGENYHNMAGVEIRNSLDTNGGQMVGQIHNGDWCMYPNINLTCATNIEARLASFRDGGDIEVRIDGVDGTLIGTISQGTTGGWQEWVTASTSITQVSGVHDVYLVFTGGASALFNFNWFQFSDYNNQAKLLSNHGEIEPKSSIDESFRIYPNPAISKVHIELNNSSGITKIDIFNSSGQLVISHKFANENKTIDVSKLPKGMYVVKITEPNFVSTKKFIKQ